MTRGTKLRRLIPCPKLEPTGKTWEEFKAAAIKSIGRNLGEGIVTFSIK